MILWTKLILTFYFFLSLYYILLVIFKEIKNKTNFKQELYRIKNNILLWNENIQPQNYGLEDALFDFFVLIYNYKHYKHVWFFSPVFLLLFLFFSWIPLLFHLIFCTKLVQYIFKITFCFILNKNCEISPPSNVPLDLYGSWLPSIFFLPTQWSFVALYLLLGGKKKFDDSVIKILVFRFLLSQPLWYFNLILYLIIDIVKILNLKIFKRKSKLIWINVFWNIFKEQTFTRLLRSYYTVDNLTMCKKIILKNRKLTLNPFSEPLTEFLKHKASISHLPFINYKIIKTKGRNHQMITSSLKSNHGFIFTSSDDVKLNKVAYPASYLGQGYNNQNYFYSAAATNLINEEKIYLRSFVHNHGLIRNSNFHSLSFRLYLLSLIHSEKIIVYQTRFSAIVRLTNSRFSLLQLYSRPNIDQTNIDYLVQILNNTTNYSDNLIILEKEIESLTPAQLLENIKELSSNSMLFNLKTKLLQNEIEQTHKNMIKNQDLFI